ncbi:T9SS type A sorting domain-containing protein [Putridiphycobacter roseus]|uniref:T9SS type A sorting domain-containing protein n=1 Tax=Putridiphycobacter roseus TaxID=2219161 RepID=UPI0011B5A882|nr:T9SS type A sorting domain-containing protein [Putridiphycobacter roseus]
MKKIAYLLLFLLPCSIFAQTTKKVAFLGNSYTYVNDLPSLIDSLANHQGDDLVHQQNTPGGYTLNGHSTNTTSLSVIAANTWDFVVLQDQSQAPSFPYAQVITDVYPKAKILCDSIRAANACAIPMFFNTWGRLNGDPQWDSINTFSKMNQRLFNAYEHMTKVNDGMLSPVGLGFNVVFNDPNPIVSHSQLYAGDGSHPSIFGSYLAACIFNDLIFETQSQANTFLPNGMTQLEANYLKGVADQVVYAATSPIFDYTAPVAAFNFTINASDVTFNNLSEHAYEYAWDFGDNNSSNLENPTHTYNQTGTFQVKLTAKYCGRQATYEQSVNITQLGIENTTIKVAVFPNPFQDQFQLLAPINASIEIVNITGKVMQQFRQTKSVQNIDLSDASKGVYFIKIQSEAQLVVKKVMKQ